MPFGFDPSTGRYRDVQTGRLVPDATIRGTLDRVIDVQAVTMRDLSQALVNGTLSLADWQLQSMQVIKSGHLIGLALANGGWNNLDQSDYGWAGQRIRTEYGYLRDFAGQIASGKQPLTSMVMARSVLYAEAARTTHRAAQRRAASARGLDQEKSNLGVCDHCGGCLSAAAQGWQRIGTISPPGSRDCLSRCHCWFTYRTVAPAA